MGALRKPKLRSVDELFGLEDESFINDHNKLVVKEFGVEELFPYEPQPFEMYGGERMEDLAQSIERHGVLTPILVREKNGKYEILAGRHRVQGCRMAGRTTVPAIVLNNVDEEKAFAIVVETNLMQRSFNDMSHSEKAAVVALHQSKMFSQGKRSDIVEQLEYLEQLKVDSESGADDRDINISHKKRLHSNEKIANEYSLSAPTVARYLRINKLIKPLKDLLDKGEIAFAAGVDVSFLKETEQQGLVDCLNNHPYCVDMKKALVLREYSKKDKLSDENILFILKGELRLKEKALPSVKFNRNVYEKYFTPKQSKKEIQTIVEEALELYFSHKDLDDTTHM